MIIKNANILYKNKFSIQDMEINDKKGTIIKIGKINKPGIDFNEEKVIPGLIDPHTHGGNGHDFNNAKTIEEMQSIIDFYIKNGVTSVFPTIMTDDDKNIKEKLHMVSELKKTNPCIIGIHLEGPFLSEEYKGAQPKEYLQPLLKTKFDEYQKAANGLIRYITISPEHPNTSEFVKALVKEGVHVSLGHSGADFDETTIAINAGANGFTHCMNAMKPIHQHYPSILAAALYYDSTYCEVIMDGIHVHPEMVNWLTKLKGYKHIIGITDSLMCAGLPNGDYFIGSTPITVKDGDCKITGTDTRAGSTLTAFKGFTNFKKFTSFGDSVASMVWSYNVSKMLHADNKIGSLKKNAFANFIVLDDNENLVHSYILGKKQF
ncbi:MAG: N-acetylglucosamine-6-phosphate deacetylase [Bacilli bacterium]|jgi:N-acetylglucosamine-6-phosphate deacetylase